MSESEQRFMIADCFADHPERDTIFKPLCKWGNGVIAECEQIACLSLTDPMVLYGFEFPVIVCRALYLLKGAFMVEFRTRCMNAHQRTYTFGELEGDLQSGFHWMWGQIKLLPNDDLKKDLDLIHDYVLSARLVMQQARLASSKPPK